VSFKIGEQKAMLDQQEKGTLLGFSVLVILWSIALLYLIFFISARFFKRRAASLLSFAIFCFLFAVGNALTDQRPLVMMLPDISFEAIFKMKDFFLSASLIVVTIIFCQARKGILSLRMTGIISAVYGCYLIAVLTLPIYLYYKLHPFIMLLNTIVLLILFVRTTVLFMRCKKSDMLDYLLLFTAILAINLYSVDSILFALSLKADSSLCQVYIVAFALVTIFRLSMHYYEVLANLKISMKRTQDAEIAFLRSQIKPHFLYNALNSIAALCKEAPAQAEDVVIQLSEYLRGSFDFKTLDSLTTVKKETELLEAYLNIEKVRFGKRLNVEYDIDESINIPIPSLILQPLVENAVRHGLMSSVGGGTVKISIKKERADVVFSIEDDGIGMEPSQVKRLLVQAPDENGVGLWNINQRLRLIYGRELEVWSERESGTRVSFRIPWNSKETSLSHDNIR
jgi:sensor histidine kinase YesM